jgi:hypothetical protein
MAVIARPWPSAEYDVALKPCQAAGGGGFCDCRSCGHDIVFGVLPDRRGFGSEILVQNETFLRHIDVAQGAQADCSSRKPDTLPDALHLEKRVGRIPIAMPYVRRCHQEGGRNDLDAQLGTPHLRVVEDDALCAV